jgi:isopenicillin N synthase-like dioxygenase
MTTSIQIPIIDFAAFSAENSSNDQLDAVAQQVFEACTTVGFLYAKNIGVSEQELATIFDVSKRFFALPDEIKSSIPWTESNRGYVKMKGEKLDPVSNPSGDPKEAFNMLATDNVWLPSTTDGINDMRPALEGFFQRSRKAALVVLQAYAMALKLEPNFFTKNSIGDKNATTLRLLKYPRRKLNPNNPHAELRAGAHTDYGSITLLWQDNAGGLQVQLRNRQDWFDVEPLGQNVCLVNTGDLLMRWSNNVLLSTRHRVVDSFEEKNGNDELWSKERFSIALFVHPDDDVSVECFESCKSDANPAQYEPINAKEYLDRLLAATY